MLDQIKLPHYCTGIDLVHKSERSGQWYLFMKELVLHWYVNVGGKYELPEMMRMLVSFTFIGEEQRKSCKSYLSWPNCPVRRLLHMFFFWHENKKFSWCNFSTNWQEAFLFIYFLTCTLSNQSNKLQSAIWQYNYTPSLLGFGFNTVHWHSAGAPAVLTCNCCCSLPAQLQSHFAL